MKTPLYTYKQASQLKASGILPTPQFLIVERLSHQALELLILPQTLPT